MNKEIKVEIAWTIPSGITIGLSPCPKKLHFHWLSRRHWLFYFFRTNDKGWGGIGLGIGTLYWHNPLRIKKLIN